MKFTKLFLSLGALAAWSFSAQAQTSVTLGGAGPLTFDTTPAATEFTTGVLNGTGATFANAGQVDSAVAAVAAASIVRALPTSASIPPTIFSGGFRHNTSTVTPGVGLWLQSRPTTDLTNAANMLLGKFRNNAGISIVTFDISYDFAIQTAAGAELPGFNVYYSLTGAAGTWVSVPALTQNTSVGIQLANITPSGGWPNGTDLFVLWVDDNDGPATDPSYTIDNLRISNVSSTILPPSVTIVTPTNNQHVAQYANLTVTTSTTGSITNVDFIVAGIGIVASDNTAPFGGTVPVTLPPATYTLTAVGWADGLTYTSAPVTVIVDMNTPPFIDLTNSYSGANTGLTFLVGSPITVQASYTDDDTITNIEWQVDGAVYLTNRINNTQIYINPTLGSGTHTFKGIATDTRGQSSSAELTFTITNPPSSQFTVLQANGDTWFYNNVGAEPADQGTIKWFERDFDASSWSNAPAELGNGDIPNGLPEKTLIDIGLGQPRYMTVYFRKYFNVDDSSLYPNLQLRGLFDDGAVVHLNGVAVWTNNITVVTDPIRYTNAANDTVSETVYQTFNLENVGLTHLVSGVNSIAVEVHQVNTNSSDLSFDLMIWGEKAGAPTIVLTSPTNTQTFAECANITINATVSTFVNQVQFFVDGNSVNIDTTAPYSFVYSGATPGPHTIKATATDSFSATVDSALVNITVVANVPPVVTFTNSYSGANTGLVFLVGSPITCQFSVSDPDSTLTSVEFLVNNVVILTTNVAYGALTVGDALAGISTFTIRATDGCGGITSDSRTFNITNPPSTLIVVSNGSSWKYFNTNSGPIADGAGEWYVNGYTDTAWLSGFAEIGGGDKVLPPVAATVPERTLLDIGPAGARYTAAYFRHQFTISNPLDYGALSVLSMHDDGAVVYLNGTIVATFNMPAGPYAYGTVASGAVAGDGTIYYRSNITASLIAGVNTLAVEVHQSAIDSSDLSFDLMLHAAGPPLTITLDTALDKATVSWGATGYVLQQSGSIGSPTVWTDVGGNPSSPVVINNVSAQGIKFFQLRQGP